MTTKNDDLRAGLIGQAIPDVDGTEPRPTCPNCPMTDICNHCGTTLDEHGCRCNGYEPEDDTCQRCGGEGLIHDYQEDTCCCADPLMEACPECCQ